MKHEKNKTTRGSRILPCQLERRRGDGWGRFGIPDVSIFFIFLSLKNVSIGFFGLVKILATIYFLIIIDRTFESKMTAVHTQLSSVKRKMTYTISSNVSMVVTIQNLLKSTIRNIIDMGINPLGSFVFEKNLIGYQT